MARQFQLDTPRLCQKVFDDRKALEFYRRRHADHVRKYAGPTWSEETSRDDGAPVNLIELYVSIVGRALIAKNPRVLLSVFDRAQKPVVDAMQAWANKEIERTCLAETLQCVVLDALFNVGICKVCLATPAEAANYGWERQAGQVHVCPIDFDDWVHDTHTRRPYLWQYCGHRYRVPREAAKAMYGKRAKDLTVSSDPRYNREGDERINVLGRGPYGMQDRELEDMVDLWEIYIPRHRWVVTLSDDAVCSAGGDEEPLWEQPWLGHTWGPFHWLGLGSVPGNCIPKAPVPGLVALNDAVNHIYVKLIEQAERQKEVTFVQGSADADGNRLVKANDGDVIRSDNPEGIVTTKWGGPNQENFLLGESLRQTFSWLAGNLDLLGGLAPQSKTLGQDKMLGESASRGVSDMQDRTVNFTARVIESMAWYWHHDPRQVMASKHSIPGLPELSSVRKVTPQQRERVPFEDLDIRIDPYSLQHKSPGERLAALNQLMQTIVLPMMPLLQQQGIAVDLNALLLKQSEWLDMPDLSDILTVREPPSDSGSSAPDEPKMPQQTSREYVRHNVGERTQQGNSAVLQNAMLGIDSGGAQRNGKPQGVGA